MNPLITAELEGRLITLGILHTTRSKTLDTAALEYDLGDGYIDKISPYLTHVEIGKVLVGKQEEVCRRKLKYGTVLNQDIPTDENIAYNLFKEHFEVRRQRWRPLYMVQERVLA